MFFEKFDYPSGESKFFGIMITRKQIIGRIWSLNKPRKWDKVNSLSVIEFASW